MAEHRHYSGLLWYCSEYVGRYCIKVTLLMNHVNHACFLQPLLHILSETLKTILPRSPVSLLQLKTFLASLHIRSVGKTDCHFKNVPFWHFSFCGLKQGFESYKN